MWKSFSLLVAAAVLAASSVAEAKRLGGGKSLGAQREAPAATRQSTPPAAAPQQAAPAAAAAGGTAAAGAAAKSGMARWAGPLAAIAAGLGLGYLFSQLGAGGFLMFLLVALAGIVLLALLARRMMKSATPASANGAPLQYQAPGRAEPSAFTSGSGGTAGVAGPSSADAAVSGIPSGFDKAGFEQQAKKQFLALQAVNDRGDLDGLRDLVTDEFYNQAAKDVIQGNKDATEFDMLNAELLSIDTDRGMYWAQVEFSGNVREDGMVMGSPFREVWNLNKPVDGSRGWLLAGIQQA